MMEGDNEQKGGSANRAVSNGCAHLTCPLWMYRRHYARGDFGLKRHDEVHLIFVMLLCHNCMIGEGENILLQNELTNICDGVKIKISTVNKT